MTYYRMERIVWYGLLCKREMVLVCMIWYGVLWSIISWHGSIQYCMVRKGTVWCGMIWYGNALHIMVFSGTYCQECYCTV